MEVTGEPILAYLVDHLGTIRAAVNQDGIVVETRDYAPFGESIAHVGAFSVQHRFTGQPQDDLEGGLYNYGARFYNPKWGRFVSPDEMVQSFDSQGLNPFTYVLNRPTSATDPTGNFTGVGGDGSGLGGGGGFGGYGSLGHAGTTTSAATGLGMGLVVGLHQGERFNDCFPNCVESDTGFWWYNDSWSSPSPLLSFAANDSWVVVAQVLTPDGRGCSATRPLCVGGVGGGGGVGVDPVFRPTAPPPQRTPTAATGAKPAPSVASPSRRPNAETRRQADAAATDAAGNLRCQYCGDKLTTKPGQSNSREYDHVDPWSRSRDSSLSNILNSCRTCNRSKGAQTPEEWLGP